MYIIALLFYLLLPCLYPCETSLFKYIPIYIIPNNYEAGITTDLLTVIGEPFSSFLNVVRNGDVSELKLGSCQLFSVKRAVVAPGVIDS